MTTADLPPAADPSPASGESFGALTARESNLLRQAGERIFAVSRKLADSEREVQQLRQEISHLGELLAETRASRDTLSAQVQSIQRDLEREYDERAELRRLLASLQMQLQSLLSAVVGGAAPPGLGLGRIAGQKPASPNGRQPEPSAVVKSVPARPASGGWLQLAAREFRAFRRR
jgi:ABC-type transporter Mla subunit MlaD